MWLFKFRVQGLLDFVKLIVTPHPQNFYIPPSVTGPVGAPNVHHAAISPLREVPPTTRREMRRTRVHPEYRLVGDHGEISSHSSYYSSSYGSRSGSGYGDWARGRGQPNDSRSSWTYSKASGSIKNPSVSYGRRDELPCCCSCHDRQPSRDRKGKGRAFEGNPAIPTAYNQRPFVWRSVSAVLW
ncbi:hypothetical protein BDN72DRAFT_839789 [Pluteus cervinus]|uniref:Uncharacterized protein n=1 Tax=Pluteus cervinus TaxID=181527 RepID=A0ACD3AVZ3_9AGAR|nr:hypothetical protein BDN72DRAFT_839789 [Pluteus cervinus]